MGDESEIVGWSDMLDICAIEDDAEDRSEEENGVAVHMLELSTGLTGPMGSPGSLYVGRMVYSELPLVVMDDIGVKVTEYVTLLPAEDATDKLILIVGDTAVDIAGELKLDAKDGAPDAGSRPVAEPGLRELEDGAIALDMIMLEENTGDPFDRLEEAVGTSDWLLPTASQSP